MKNLQNLFFLALKIGQELFFSMKIISNSKISLVYMRNSDTILFSSQNFQYIVMVNRKNERYFFAFYFQQ